MTEKKELSQLAKTILSGAGHITTFTQTEFDEALNVAKAEIMAVAIETTKQAIFIEREACAEMAMQEADEIEGVESPKEYQDLMQRIENTARVRFYNSVDLERDNQKPSRDEMISKLVEYEYNFLLESKEYLIDMLRDGFSGFENWTDERIATSYNDKFGED